VKLRWRKYSDVAADFGNLGNDYSGSTRRTSVPVRRLRESKSDMQTGPLIAASLRRGAMRAAKMLALTGLSAQLLLLGPVSAADYPSRPIKLLVGASAGGTTDTMARTIAEPLSRLFGQPVLVENRPGAGGNLAAEAVARSNPDGYTLLVSFTSHTINATLYPKLPFDPVADFTPIAMISTVPSLLVGNPKIPAQNLRELIALAKAKPDALTMAIGGIGSSLHLAGDRFKMMADISIVNVPYKGTAPALADVMGGQVDLMFISLVTGTAQVQAGNLGAYGVTSAARQPSFPDLPAIGEIVAGFESAAWFGVFGPAKLSDEIVAKLNGAVVNALKDVRMREQLLREGANPAALTPAEFAAFVRQDIERWAPVVRSSGAKPE
jgi:tripartite-type tricarboxylate transporter receptor subunit TctC